MPLFAPTETGTDNSNVTYPSDPTCKILCFLFPSILCSACLEILVPKGTLPPGDLRILLKQKLRLTPGHFDLLMPLNQQEKKENTVLTQMIDTDYQWEIGLLFHTEI